MKKLMVKSEGECNLLKSNSGTSFWRNNNSYWWNEFQVRRTRTRRREKSNTHPKFRDKIASARKTSSRGPIDYFFACYRENGNAPKSTNNLPNTPRKRYPAESCTLDRHTTPLLSVTTSGDQNVQKISILFRVTDGGGKKKPPTARRRETLALGTTHWVEKNLWVECKRNEI